MKARVGDGLMPALDRDFVLTETREARRHPEGEGPIFNGGCFSDYVNLPAHTGTMPEVANWSEAKLERRVAAPSPSIRVSR
jgi:hypothetical protein